jgi:hypothetical protein
MDSADHIEVPPKIRVFTPKNAYIREVWTFIYRFMHNLLGLFAKCLINLEKQKPLPVKFYSVAEVSHIFFRPRTKKLIRPFGFDSRLKTFMNLLY